MSADFDLAIIGSGFAGSLLAMIARRLGRTVVLIERAKHPRFAIGESSTPLANLLLEQLAQRYELPRLLPLCQWGTWQQSYPEIGCGLKRGFSFYHHKWDHAFASRPDHANELLVAASPADIVADTHWYRPEFDALLAREAVALGAELLEETELIELELGMPNKLTGRLHGQTVSLGAGFLIDASGPHGFLHRALGLHEEPFGPALATQALFSHFQGVRRWAEVCAPAESPPYPPDDAALHHVFPGGWIWVLRFNNGLTSAGVALTDARANELRLAEGAPAWERLLTRLPSVQAQFAGAEPTLPFSYTPRLPFRTGPITGDRWALLPSAAGFVDPLLSTGFPLTLLGISRLAGIFATTRGTADLAPQLQDYAARTRQELDVAARLVAALYRHMENFPAFIALTKLYFAAASYTETALRLGRPALCGDSFLLAGRPDFAASFHRCLNLAENNGVSANDALAAAIVEAITPFDLAGLGDPARRNWHPVRAEDLFAAAGKVKATRTELAAMLSACGFTDTVGP